MRKTLLFTLILTLGLAAALSADDTDIYGVSKISVKPNVLIVFDRSGSMDTNDVPGDPYDHDTDYSSYDSYIREAVYVEYYYRWYRVTDDIVNLRCDRVADPLIEKGYTRDRLRSDLSCSSLSSVRYRTGNYLNYLTAGLGATRKRIDVAKEVIAGLIQDQIDVEDTLNLGLMYFPSDYTYWNYDGGRLVSEVGTDKAALLTTVNSLTAGGWTPLAESLADAGNYFADQTCWYVSNSFASPIDVRCRQNYIIVMTDGEPTQDRHNFLTTKEYLHGSTIGDYDADGMESSNPATRGNGYVQNWGDTDTSNYLDDIAKILRDTDLSPLGTPGDFEKQNVKTFTIGFKTDQVLLNDTAENGGGEYFTANNASDLKEAFESIFAAISETNEVFVAPVVPVSRENRTFAGDRLFIGFFQPKSNGVWWGNIKKFGLNEDGDILDADNNPATDTATGAILSTSRSYWSSVDDGSKVGEGGLGEVLLNRDITTFPRKIYTYTGATSSRDLGGTDKQLSDPDNAFTTSNGLITEGVLGVALPADRTDLIFGVHDGYFDTAGIDKWRFGDVIHGKPTVVDYLYDSDGDGLFEYSDGDRSLVFTATNWGILGAYDDEDGQELWAFTPPDLLGKLKELSDAVPNHDYFVDATPTVYYGTDKTILFTGERRGGYFYHALDISDHDDPYWQYEIGPDKLGGGDSELGQSWSTAKVAKIATDGSGGEEKVFVLSGGYDVNQDKPLRSRIPEPYIPPGLEDEEIDALFRDNTDTVGRAVFAVNVETGALSSLNINPTSLSSMTHSIIDLISLDHDEDGITSRVYAGDLGGGMFAIRDDIDDDDSTPEMLTKQARWTVHGPQPKFLTLLQTVHNARFSTHLMR